jgi:hypothetical protein
MILYKAKKLFSQGENGTDLQLDMEITYEFYFSIKMNQLLQLPRTTKKTPERRKHVTKTCPKATVERAFYCIQAWASSPSCVR